MRRILLTAFGCALIAGACDTPVSPDDTLRYWFVDVTGHVRDSAGVPISPSQVLWQHRAPCEETQTIEHFAVETDGAGAYEVPVQVETADGCFAFIASTPAGDSAAVVRPVRDFPLAQDEPHETVVVDLIM